MCPFGSSGVDFWKLVTVLIALFAAYVAYQQFRLGREKFKLDLFEKRFQVFAAARRLLSHVLTDANLELTTLFEYRAGIAEATFLFDDGLTTYLRESAYSLPSACDRPCRSAE